MLKKKKRHHAYFQGAVLNIIFNLIYCPHFLLGKFSGSQFFLALIVDLKKRLKAVPINLSEDKGTCLKQTSLYFFF